MSRVRNTPYSGAISVAVIVAIALLLVFTKVLLIPLSFALTLAFLLGPAVAWMEGKGLSRVMAVLITTGLACVAVIVGGTVVSRQVLHVVETLPSYRANIEGRLATLHSSRAGSLEADVAMLDELAATLMNKHGVASSNAVTVRMETTAAAQLEATEELASDVLAPLAALGIVFIFTIYMLMNREDLRHRLLLLAGMTHINLMSRALEDATERISKYLVMQFQVNACYGVLFGTGLYFLGVPDATLWGVLAGVLRIVPFAGTLIGMLLPLVLSIAVSPSWAHPVGVVALFLVLELTLVNLIEPWLFSERTGISSLALLASAIFWSMLWGWPGLVLSTPLTVCVVVLGRYVPQLSFLHSLLGTEARLSPAAHVYERLLAMDQAEALAIAEEVKKKTSVDEMYDGVILPVLALAQEDRQKGELDSTESRFVQLSMAELIARQAEPYDGEMTREFAVVCVFAGGRSAELSTTMLTQLLERDGYQTLTVAADGVSDEVLRALAAEPNTVLVLSALPPFAFAQLKALYLRVRGFLPQNRIAVALWRSGEEGDEWMERFGGKRPDAVVGTLEQGVKQVKEWGLRRVS